MVDKKPYFVVFVIQISYAGYYLLTKIAFDDGMNTAVFVFYRQAIATLLLIPLAIFFERKTAPPLSISTFIKIFLLAFFGITTSLNVIGVALEYTSASLGASISNACPVITFIFAVLLRMEKMNLRTSPGIMKISGVFLLIAGILTMAFYRGPLLNILMHHHLINNQLQQIQHNTWTKGVFLMLLSNVTWGAWLVFQGRVLKDYASKLVFTTLQCLFSMIQSFVVAIVFERNFDEWKLGWNVRLLSVMYCGIVVTGFNFYLQAWVIEKKGPVFLAMNTPLIMVFTMIISAVILGEILSLGSVLGAILLVGGLYFVLWGKTKEEKMMKKGKMSDVEKTSTQNVIEPKDEIAAYK